MSDTTRTIKCPNPAFRSLVAAVSEVNFANSGGTVPPEGTLYGAAAWKTFFGSDYRKEFANFRYISQLEDTKTGGQLLFAAALTTDQRNTPYRTITRFGNHHWHPILKELHPIQIRGFPYATQTGTGTYAYANRYVMREVYIPAVTEGSRFIEDEFFSDIPFSIPQYPTPCPAAVNYSFLNMRGGFPECLHKRIDIGALVSTLGGPPIPGQIFPATNFTEWQTYILSDRQELTSSGYYRKRVRVFPPPVPRIITSL